MPKDKTTDPTTEAEKAQARAESERAEANRTTRELGKNSAGEPTLYPSDVESVATAHNLTIPEAEEHLTKGTSPDELKGRRVIYRQTYEQVPASAHALTAVDISAARQEEERRAAEKDTPEAAVDPTQPEAGPYGPHADYRRVDVSAEEVAQQSGLPVDIARKAVGK